MPPKTASKPPSTPGGIPGVETQMPLMLTEVAGGRMTINDYVRWAAANPAKAWDLYPQKGAVAVRADADLVVLDMNYHDAIEQASLHSRHKSSRWQGRLRGAGRCTCLCAAAQF